jgi:hypothetical protein
MLRARLQDEVATAAVESLASCCAVADPSQPGAPLVHVSAGLEALSGFAAAELVGRSCSEVRLRGESCAVNQGCAPQPARAHPT